MNPPLLNEINRYTLEYSVKFSQDEEYKCLDRKKK